MSLTYIGNEPIKELYENLREKYERGAKPYMESSDGCQDLLTAEGMIRNAHRYISDKDGWSKSYIPESIELLQYVADKYPEDLI